MLLAHSKHLKRVLTRHFYCSSSKIYQTVLKNKLNYHHSYQYSQQQIQYSKSTQNETASKSNLPENIVSLEQLSDFVQQDIRHHFANYQIVKSSFSYHLNNNTFQQQQPLLVQVLEKLAHYPVFLLSNQEMLAIYKILCYNMHLKSVETLNTALKFVLVADSNVSQSPIYLEFIKFYLQIPREYIKVKYQIDFQKLSVWQAVKQFIGRTVQRGFLPRSPQYYRNLNILQHEQILLRLVKRKDTKDSLMIKKLNYTIFMDLKEFYEEEMNENLYHYKKIELMGKFDRRFMQVLAEELTITHHQNTHLRELYMKLYLTLPINNKIDALTLPQQERPNLQQNIQALKIKNVVYLYKLAQTHIARMDGYKLQEIRENIDVVIQFVQAVEFNFRTAAATVTDLQHLGLAFDQMLLIIELLNSLNVQTSPFFAHLLQRVRQILNPLLYSTHFENILKLIQGYREVGCLDWLVESAQLLSYLSLQQLHSLCELIQQTEEQSQRTLFRKIGETVVQSILSRDFEVIGGYEITMFLNIQQKTMLYSSAQVETLRTFIMRYISDHHKEFSLFDFQNILNQLLTLPPQSCTHFEDENGNYPNSIFQELHPYLTKVNLLLSSKTTLKIAQRTAKKTQSWYSDGI